MKIIENLQEEYKKYIEVNTAKEGDESAGSSYAQGILNASERVGCALDDGKTPEEAIECLTGGEDGKELTGYMAGAAIAAVCHFSPRGEELRIAWNKRYGVGPEAKGTVNPAIVTVGK